MRKAVSSIVLDFIGGVIGLFITTAFLGLVLLLLGGCATTSVNKPCGVITDSLKDVHATTRDGERRISTHYEAGVAAGCWSR